VHMIGEKIRALRQALGLSQQKLADRAGIHRQHLMRIEAGKSDPGFSIVLRLVDALRVDVAELFISDYPQVEQAVERITKFRDIIFHGGPEMEYLMSEVDRIHQKLELDE